MKTTNLKTASPVLVIFAPTATGKTALSLELFGKSSHSFLKGKAEIISADSMQVYCGMDIGTAKPEKSLLEELPHHLIDIRKISEQYTAADFVHDADECCKKIWNKGKLPVLCGGTGFYIRNFLLGLPSTPESNPELREKLKLRSKTEGLKAMYSELQKVDPESALKININDEYRILRALEVYYITGKPRSAFKMTEKLRDGYNFFTVILERERQELYERINDRVEQMFNSGLKEEVLSLKKEGFTQSDPGMQAIGYREFFMGKSLENDAILKAQIKTDSRHYAKKQYVFMQGIPGAKTYRISGEENGIKEIALDIEEFFRFYASLT